MTSSTWICRSAKPANQTARATRLKVMLCPTDAYNEQPFNGSGHAPTAHLNDHWARGNYGANAALGYRVVSHVDPDQMAGWPDTPAWQSSTRRGVMGINASISMSEMTDGGSQTILLAELRAGVVEEDERGVWAMANTASALWGHGGVNTDAFGPNSPMDAGDDCAGCSRAQAAFGGAEALARRGMGCWGGDASRQSTGRAQHARKTASTPASATVASALSTNRCRAGPALTLTLPSGIVSTPPPMDRSSAPTPSDARKVQGCVQGQSARAGP